MTFLSAPEALDRLAEVEARLDSLWALPEPLTALEWGRKHINLTTGNRKGNWEPDPYQKEIILAATDPTVRRVTFMKPAQVGWSLICQIVIGYFVHHLALPTMHIWPSQGAAEKFAKDRLDPMIHNTPVLAEMLIRPTAKNTGSTTRHKVFTNGGIIDLASAGNPRELRQTQAAAMIFDERSAWKVDLGGEGNPARIAEARGKTYPDLKIFEGSTPGALPKGVDPTDIAWNLGSRGRWVVPCPHCNGWLRLQWSDRDTKRYFLRFERQNANGTLDEKGRFIVPGSVAYTCLHCGALIEEKQKWAMAQNGHFHHDAPERTLHRSFHMTALGSLAGDPWELLAQQWLDAQDDPTELKTFITLNLGEAWEDRGDTVNETILRQRAEVEDRPIEQIPDGVGVLTAFVDIQGEGSGKDNYFAASLWGWGDGHEGWLVDRLVEPGDIADPDMWAALEAWLQKDRRHKVSGRVMRPAITFIDSGSGGHAEAVYSFVKSRQGAARRVFASKGVAALDRGLVREGTTKKARIRLFQMSNAAWKPRVFGMLQRGTPGPGFLHLLRDLPDSYLEELTSEAWIPIKDPKTGRISGKWERLGSRKNEAWDCLGGAYCALWALQNLLAPGAFGDLKALAEEARKPQNESKEPAPAPPRMPSGGSMGGGLSGGLGFGGGFGSGLGGGFKPW